MEDKLLKVKENSDWEAFVVDPLDYVYWQDSFTYDCPEDLTIHRNMSAWIDEVNRLRTLCLENGLDVAKDGFV